jgi:hypothetical protein
MESKLYQISYYDPKPIIVVSSITSLLVNNVVILRDKRVDY